MLKNKLTLVGICFLVSLGLQAQQSMSLEQCITYAIENHISLKNAQLEQEKAGYKITETKATGLPQVNGKIDFTENVKVQSQFLPANAFDPTGDPNKTIPLAFGVAHSANASVTASQMIFNGSYLVGLQAARTYEILSQQNKDKSEEDIRVNVTKAYYGALVNQERIAMILTNKAQIEKLQDDARILVKEGMMEPIELSKLTVSLNNLITELEKIESLQKISDNLLKFNMGMPLTENLVLTDQLNTILTSSDVNTAAQLNVAGRKDYQILETQLELTELNIKNYKMNSLPSAAAFGTMGANNGTITFSELPKFGNWRPYGYVGAQINIPMFSSFRNKSLIQIETVNKQLLINNMNLASQGFEFEYYQHLENYNNYKKSLDRQRENLLLANQIYENAKIKYTNGVGSSYDIVVAESSLKTAQSGYLSTVYDLLVTKVDLEKTSGNFK